MNFFLNLIILFLGIFITPSPVESENSLNKWKSHSSVVKEVIKTYENINTLKVYFTIQTKNKISMGIAYYQKPGKTRFEFSKPSGDLLISDGKTLWIVVGSQNLVGKQDLTLNAKDENNKPIFSVLPVKGIQHLFERYHYKFDDINQPKEIDGKKYYVLVLEQKEKIGGYEKMKIFINAETFLIEKAIAEGNYGIVTTVNFSNFSKNIELEGKLFQFNPPENSRIVSNPLVSED